MLTHFGIWLFSIIFTVATISYFNTWRRKRTFQTFFQWSGCLLLAGLAFSVALPDAYDRINRQYVTETGTCYIVENTSRRGGVTLWMNGQAYDFRSAPDIPYGEHMNYECEVTLTVQNLNEVSYTLFDEGVTVFKVTD